MTDSPEARYCVRALSMEKAQLTVPECAAEPTPAPVIVKEFSMSRRAASRAEEIEPPPLAIELDRVVLVEPLR